MIKLTQLYIEAMTNIMQKLLMYTYKGDLTLPQELVMIEEHTFSSICNELANIQYGKSEAIMNTALDKTAKNLMSNLVLFLGVDGNPVKAMSNEYHLYPVITLDCYVYDFMLGVNAAPIGEYLDFLFAFNDRLRMSKEFTWIPFQNHMPGLLTFDMYEQLTSKEGLSFNYTLTRRVA